MFLFKEQNTEALYSFKGETDLIAAQTNPKAVEFLAKRDEKLEKLKNNIDIAREKVNKSEVSEEIAMDEFFLDLSQRLDAEVADLENNEKRNKYSYAKLK